MDILGLAEDNLEVLLVAGGTQAAVDIHLEELDDILVPVVDTQVVDVPAGIQALAVALGPGVGIHQLLVAVAVDTQADLLAFQACLALQVESVDTPALVGILLEEAAADSDP